jgi:hypothetical protein
VFVTEIEIQFDWSISTKDPVTTIYTLVPQEGQKRKESETAHTRRRSSPIVFDENTVIQSLTGPLREPNISIGWNPFNNEFEDDEDTPDPHPIPLNLKPTTEPTTEPTMSSAVSSDEKKRKKSKSTSSPAPQNHPFKVNNRVFEMRWTAKSSNQFEFPLSVKPILHLGTIQIPVAVTSNDNIWIPHVRKFHLFEVEEETPKGQRVIQIMDFQKKKFPQNVVDSNAIQMNYLEMFSNMTISKRTLDKVICRTTEQFKEYLVDSILKKTLEVSKYKQILIEKLGLIGDYSTTDLQTKLLNLEDGNESFASVFFSEVASILERNIIVLDNIGSGFKTK